MKKIVKKIIKITNLPLTVTHAFDYLIT